MPRRKRLLGIPTTVVLVAITLHASVFAQGQNPQQPPIVITGGGGAGGGSGGGGGGAGAGGGGGAGGGAGGGGLYDGYVDIDWNGPDVFPRSPLIFQPFPANELVSQFRAATSHLPASVRKEDLTYDRAIANIHQLLTSDAARAVIEALRREALAPEGAANVDNYGTAAGMAGKRNTHFASIFARHLANPNDPTRIFNMAGILSQHGFANEAMAMLNRLKASGTPPTLPMGFKPDAAIKYVEGFAQLLRGELRAAKALLSDSFNSDRTIADASYALAVADQALGLDPRKPMLEGFLQAYGGQPLMYCGDKYEEDPLTTEEEQNVGPPADKIFDLSEGKDGVLPQYPHPAGGEQLVGMLETFGTKMQALQAEILEHDARSTALYATLGDRLANDPKPTDLEDQALVDLMDESNACLKPLHRMKTQLDEATDALADADPNASLIVPRMIEIEGMENKVQARAAARGLVNDGISNRRVAIQRWDAALRIRFKSWHKYATAIAGTITDPDWRKYADEKILIAAKTESLTLYVGIVSNYTAGLPASKEIFAPDPGLPVSPYLVQPLPPCTPAQKKGSVEIDMINVSARGLPMTRPMIGVSAEFGCDKISVEMDGMVGVGLEDVVQIGAGGFIEGSFNRGGDYTIFGGPKLTGSVGPTRGSLRDGVFITVDDHGISSVGTRIDAAQRAGAAKLQTFEKDFVIWSAPPRPQRIDRTYGLLNWPTVR